MSPSAAARAEEGESLTDAGPVALLGYLGPLAHATADVLSRRQHPVLLLEYDRLAEARSRHRPSALVCFPFPASTDRAALGRLASDLSALRAALEWAAGAGTTRVVLRSHAVAYGVSWHNYGLLREDRASLLPARASQARWVRAEQALWEVATAYPALSAAAVRLVSVLEPGEGDYLTRLLTSRIACVLPGHDPQVQVVSLADAAEALAAAALGRARGVFNATADGVIPLKAALRASGTLRLPVGRGIQKWLRSWAHRAGGARFPGDCVEEIRYGWTVSGDRAARELGFAAQSSGVEALRRFVAPRPRARPETLRPRYDDYGLDPAYLARWGLWFAFLRRAYWRIEIEGIEHVPAAGPGVFVSNHRGFMPLDGVMHRHLIREARGRDLRFLVIPSLWKLAVIHDFVTKQGAVASSETNAARLLDHGELVGVFPEGLAGAFRSYKGAYRLGPFDAGFARIAVRSGAPIVPAATVGHVEIFPILAKIRSRAVTRWGGCPFLPITPTFPLLPVPLPSKWHVRYLPPIPAGHLRPDDADRPSRVHELSRLVRDLMQRHIDEILARRTHVFFGNIFTTPTRLGDQSR